MNSRLSEDQTTSLPHQPGWGQGVCRFGRAFLAWEAGRITQLGFADAGRPVNSSPTDDSVAAEWLARIIENNAAPAIALTGSSFQQRVWNCLQNIPRGETRSYAEIADSVGCASARAVGQAIAANRIALLIPCHRVIRSDGELGGFRWGLSVKSKLLEWEGAWSAPAAQQLS